MQVIALGKIPIYIIIANCTALIAIMIVAILIGIYYIWVKINSSKGKPFWSVL